MKSIKTILVVFTVSVILGLTGVNALGEHVSYVGFKLKAHSGVETSEVYQKTKEGVQYMYTIGAVDNITGGDRSVSAQVVGAKPAEYITAPEGQYSSWAESFTKDIHGYYLNLKATKSTFATVTYTGTWYLDDALIN